VKRPRFLWVFSPAAMFFFQEHLSGPHPGRMRNGDCLMGLRRAARLMSSNSAGVGSNTQCPDRTIADRSKKQYQIFRQYPDMQVADSPVAMTRKCCRQATEKQPIRNALIEQQHTKGRSNRAFEPNPICMLLSVRRETNGESYPGSLKRIRYVSHCRIAADKSKAQLHVTKERSNTQGINRTIADKSRQQGTSPKDQIHNALLAQ
jgi:hypothetical protein